MLTMQSGNKFQIVFRNKENGLQRGQGGPRKLSRRISQRTFGKQIKTAKDLLVDFADFGMNTVNNSTGITFVKKTYSASISQCQNVRKNKTSSYL